MICESGAADLNEPADDLSRYRRNMDIPGFGIAGQQRLLNSAVLVVGAGGLGSAALPYLAAAGVGRIGIADGDHVEEMNLQRQVLHTEIGANKALSAAARLRELNPGIIVEAHPVFLTSALALTLIPEYDLVLDCCDAFTAKFMLSDICVSAGRPLVWGAAVGMQGQCSVFGVADDQGRVLSLRDLIPREPDEYPTAADIGVLGAMVGQIGALQANEAIKVLAGFGEPLVGRVMVLDAASGRWGVLPLAKTRESGEI